MPRKAKGTQRPKGLGNVARLTRGYSWQRQQTIDGKRVRHTIWGKTLAALQANVIRELLMKGEPVENVTAIGAYISSRLATEVAACSAEV